jgi:chemosensory pili system protein ChpA (sensor histidine kinase/response regulator)
MSELAVESLELVNRELANALDQARQSLENFIDGRAGKGALVDCARQLHMVRGALKIVEVHGAALLAEEMERACEFLTELNNQEAILESAEALGRAMVQLPAYLDRVASGGRDIALVLLPLLNDLRSVRGEPLMSEGTLLLLNVGPGQGAGPMAPDVDSAENFTTVAVQLRPSFQLALLGWIRGRDLPGNWSKLYTVSRALEGVASVDAVYQLWYVLSGVLQALQHSGIESSVALQRLVGQADRFLKITIDRGERAAALATPTDLLNHLLYYVGRSKVETDRIKEIRSSFGLANLLPGDNEVTEAREGLSGPSVKLMRTVAAAIKEDLGNVKDALDIFVRTGMSDVDELKPQLEMLKKISDTLGVLGLGELRAQIQGEMKELANYIGDKDAADESKLIKMAATLLNVEDALDQQLVEIIMPGDPALAADSDGDPESRVAYRHVAEAVLRECAVNLARIKEAVTQLVSHPGDARALDQLVPQLRGVTAGLLMLGKTRAVKVIERIGVIISTRLAPGQPELKPDKLDRLADSIVSVEYYMETLKAGRSDPWYMLDNAEVCLQVLESLPVVAVPRTAVEHPVPRPAVTETPAATPQPVPTETPAAVAQLSEPPAQVAVEAPAGDFAPAVMSAQDERADPELVEVFIDEAREELASIRKHFPQWLRHADDSEALITVRRSFHTLKGSGRMVGAQLIGEYAWSIENLLNRLINQTLQPTAAMLAFLQQAVDALPELLEQLEIGRPPRSDIHLIMKQAEAYADGDPDAAGLTSPSVRVAALQDQPAAQDASIAVAEPEMDPVLREIFIKETRGHIAEIRSFLEGSADASATMITEDLHRVCHTLAGSANMASFAPAIELAAPLDRLISDLFKSDGYLDSAARSVIEAIARALEDMANALESGQPYEDDYRTLLQQLNRVAVLPAAEHPTAPEQPVAEAAYPHPAPERDVRGDGDGEVGAGTVVEATEVGIAPVAPPPEPAAARSVEFDPEIAAIFTAEAAELLESAEDTLRALANDPADRGPLVELQRFTHTLKGGARMAGLAPMGNLSHALESLLEACADGRVQTPGAAIMTIQTSLDELHRMREAVVGGSGLSESVTLIAHIEHLVETGGVVAEPVDEVLDDDSPSGTSLLPQLDISPEAAQPSASDRVDQTAVLALSDEQAFELAAAEAAHEIADESAGEAAAQDHPDVDLSAELIEAQPQPAPPGGKPTALATPSLDRPEMARVDAELLDGLLNSAGEISIFQSRLNRQIHSIEFNLVELSQTVTRLKEQLRKLEAETEAQILHRHHQDSAGDHDFDPLELDRYSAIQQLSRALAESVSDVASINDLLRTLNTDAETLLTQQGRVTTELQDGLMQTRMVPFKRHVSRLERIVRQAALDSAKQAELVVEGAAGEIDRQVLENMLPPFEHLLRNAVVHGIESPEQRRAASKPETGRITVTLRREGAEVQIEVADDGAGLNLRAIRAKAQEQGLIEPGQVISDEDAMEMILAPGFTTAGELTQTAGRGVGMDVVDNQITKLGGSLRITSEEGKGTRFIMRLPYTLAITQALIVQVGEETFALPLPTVEGITRIPKDRLLELLTEDDPRLEYGGVQYRIQHLGTFVDAGPSALPEDEHSVSLVLVRAGDSSAALLTDQVEGSREIVVKTLGPQIAGIPGVSGATILGDGRIVVILDMGALVRLRRADSGFAAEPQLPLVRSQPTALIVDDSITVRRVTERLLERHNIRVLTAKDGLDAITVLQDHQPDVILLDIEMPRMDGYQFASHVRNDNRLKEIPIIMITSRSSEKHRARAIELGVNDYLVKPYQENQLLAALQPFIGSDDG